MSSLLVTPCAACQCLVVLPYLVPWLRSPGMLLTARKFIAHLFNKAERRSTYWLVSLPCLAGMWTARTCQKSRPVLLLRFRNGNQRCHSTEHTPGLGDGKKVACLQNQSRTVYIKRNAEASPMWMSFLGDVSADAPRYKQSAIKDSLSQLRCNLKICPTPSLEGVYGCRTTRTSRTGLPEAGPLLIHGESHRDSPYS